MVHLTRASRELYRRTPDECFETLPELWQHYYQEREASSDCWHRPESLEVQVTESQVSLGPKEESPHFLNDRLVTQRNQRRDSFVRVLTKAMSETLGPDAESATKDERDQGAPQPYPQAALLDPDEAEERIFVRWAKLPRLKTKSGYRLLDTTWANTCGVAGVSPATW